MLVKVHTFLFELLLRLFNSESDMVPYRTNLSLSVSRGVVPVPSSPSCGIVKRTQWRTIRREKRNQAGWKIEGDHSRVVHPLSRYEQLTHTSAPAQDPE